MTSLDNDARRIREAFDRNLAAYHAPADLAERARKGGQRRARNRRLPAIAGLAELAGRGLAVRIAVPVTAAISAAAAALAVALPNASAPAQASYTLTAQLTVHPPAHRGDAAAVLRQLAARAAARPAKALGPVEYSSNTKWEYIGHVSNPFNRHYRYSYSIRAWDAVSGASAVRIVRNSNGKVYTSSYRATKWSVHEGAWINPANLPASTSALRHHLLAAPGGSGVGLLSWRTVFVATAIKFMSGEPLPPAVRAAMLREMARIAAHSGPGYTYVDMGTATDHLGRTGVAIGQEQANSGGPQYVGLQSLIFDPRTGALLDVANAQCEIPMGAIPTTTKQCTPISYTEFNAPRAVPAVPHFLDHNPSLFVASWPY